MSPVDVRQLPDNEKLVDASFPAAQHSDFRVHIASGVHRGIAEHAKTDTSIEICGVLVGMWKKDEDGPYAVVTEYIRCDNASSKFAEVTFTHESWAQINQEMDSKYADQRIIGWYHSHPDFGIFLSDRDCFIQENFFSGAGQIAYVIDPVRELEGVFEWRNGKPQAISHYWAGERIIPVEASKKAPAAVTDAGAGGAQPTANQPAAYVPQARSPIDLTTMLSWLCVFLLGYLLAGMKSRWEQERIVEGVVAHYGINKLMRLGFEEQLRDTRLRLDLIGDHVDELLGVDQAKLSDEQRMEFSDRKQRVSQALSLSQEILRKVEEVYGYTQVERSALARLVAAKGAELTGLLNLPSNAENSGSADGAVQSTSSKKSSTDKVKKSSAGDQ